MVDRIAKAILATDRIVEWDDLTMNGKNVYREKAEAALLAIRDIADKAWRDMIDAALAPD